MNLQDDPFVSLAAGATDPFATLAARPVGAALAAAMPAGGVVLGRLHGFDLLDQPLVAGLQALPGQVVAARSTVPLRHGQRGQAVVVCFELGDPLRPIVLGVLEPQTPRPPVPAPGLRAEVDGERLVVEAQRELVLRCGEASITLTRSGKVLIQGTYIASRSKGSHKIKGASVDIN